jgi:FtsZ-interacting cell division protein ZipA
MFAALGLAWKLGGFRGVLKMIPQWVWIALAVVILVVGAFWFHGHQVSKFEKSTRADQKQLDQAAFDKLLKQAHTDALNWKTKYETAQATNAQKERNLHEQVLRDNAAIARDLSLRGAGAASSHCGPINSTRPVAGPSGPRTAPSTSSPAAAQVSAGDWATVPWRWLVNVVTQHDDLLDEAQRWRNDKAKQNELYQTSVQPEKS